MAIQIPPDVEDRIRAQLHRGAFSSEIDVIWEALDTLEKRQAGLESLKQMVAEADAQIANGRIDLFDRERTKQTLRERLASNGTDG